MGNRIQPPGFLIFLNKQTNQKEQKAGRSLKPIFNLHLDLGIIRTVRKMLMNITLWFHLLMTPPLMWQLALHRPI